MVLNYSNSVSNIVCVDLLNSSWEDIHNYCLISNSANGLKMYLKHLYNSLHNNLFDESNPHLIYIDNDYIVATKRHQQSIYKLSLGHTEILPDTSIDNLDKSIFPLLENELLKKNSLVFISDLSNTFKYHFNELLKSKKYNAIFIDAHIEVKGGLAISYSELCKKYSLTIKFLDCVNQPDISHFTLHKIYFKNRLPIIFVFKSINGLEYMGWNREYLNALNNVTPVNLISIDKKRTLNAILDKINCSGISGLNNDEISFLDAYSIL